MLHEPADSPKMVTLLRIAAEGRDVVAHPLQRGDLIEDAVVAGRRRTRLGGQRRMREEAHRPEAIVDGDQHDALLRQRGAVVPGSRAGAGHQRAAVDPHHDRPRLVGLLGRAPDVEEEAVLVALDRRATVEGLGIGAPAASRRNRTPWRRARPSRQTAGAGGFQRSSPTGGAAYGMPFHTRTVGSSADGAPPIRPCAVATSACTGSAAGADDAAGCVVGGTRAGNARARPERQERTCRARRSAARRRRVLLMSTSFGGVSRIVSPLSFRGRPVRRARAGRPAPRRSNARRASPSAADRRRGPLPSSRAARLRARLRKRSSAGGAGRPRRRRCSRSRSKRRVCSAASASS